MKDGKIFISYRRVDSAHAAGRLYDSLSARFGEEQVFMDVEQLDPGVNFVEAIDKAVSECDVLIALIGPGWLSAQDENGNRRLDNPLDFVRLEIAAALEREIRVVPLLLQGASPPKQNQLPEDLQPLAQLHAFEIRHERFRADADRLMRSIDTYRGESRRKIPPRIGGLGGRTWIGGGLAVALALALVYWGGTALLGDIGTTPTPEPTLTTVVALAATKTNTPRPDTPTPTRVPPSPTPDFGAAMVLIPAGPFEMGGDADTALAECEKLRIGGDCQRDWFTDEEPVHTVMLDQYYIDPYEVTNAAYEKCVAAGACDPPEASRSYTRDSYYGNSQYDDYPVIRVTWYAAQAYCEWRGARLPTEAEWEKAARGGLERKNYPWGDDFDGDRANFCDAKCEFDWANKDFDDGYADTAPVGSYAPNGYGLYDMAGNVWEWVSSLYQSYPYDATDGREDLEASGGRVLRGGSWYHNGYYLRVALRNYYDPSYTFSYSGFRCARSP